MEKTQIYGLNIGLEAFSLIFKEYSSILRILETFSDKW